MKNRNSTNKIIIVLGPINWGEMRRAEAGNDKKGVTFHPHFTPPPASLRWDFCVTTKGSSEYMNMKASL